MLIDGLLAPLRQRVLIGALLALAGCSCDHPPEAVDRSNDTSAPIDTGVPPPCVDPGLCSVEVASATWSGGARWGWTGYELKAGEVLDTPVVLVGSPAEGPARAFALATADLSLLGTWEDPNLGDSSLSSQFGQAIAISPTGALVAVGARSGGWEQGGDGLVYLFDHLPTGTQPPTGAHLVLVGDFHERARFGMSVDFLALSGEGSELIVGTGSVDEGLPSAVFRFDPELTGTHGVDAARATITGAAIFGQQIAGWDADGDGLAELVTSTDEGVIHFPGPWIGDLLESDADVFWSERHPEDQLADTIEVLDDLDGDGRPDLAITANTFSATTVRAGAAYLVPAGPLQSMPAEALAYQFLGTELGEGVGSAATSGDYDGDGQPDLVIGAYGVFPGEQTGKILGYLGPLTPGIRTAADADFVVHGERVADWFGAEAVTVDADGDSRDDLVVSAQGWDTRGKVYLLLGRDLLP